MSSSLRRVSLDKWLIEEVCSGGLDYSVLLKTAENNLTNMSLKLSYLFSNSFYKLKFMGLTSIDWRIEVINSCKMMVNHRTIKGKVVNFSRVAEVRLAA